MNLTRPRVPGRADQQVRLLPRHPRPLDDPEDEIAQRAPERLFEGTNDGPIERLQLVTWWDFGETPAGTQVTVRQLYHGGWLRLYRWLLFERRMQGLLARTLAGLKAYVERGTPGGQA